MTGPLPEGEPRKVVQEADIRIMEAKDYRSIHVNGSVGSYNQFGEIYVSVFTERAANAERGKFQLLEDGSTNIVPERTAENTGVVRELQIGMFMSARTAENLIGLLAGILTNLNSAVEEAQKEEAARSQQESKE